MSQVLDLALLEYMINEDEVEDTYQDEIIGDIVDAEDGYTDTDLVTDTIEDSLEDELYDKAEDNDEDLLMSEDPEELAEYDIIDQLLGIYEEAIA